MPEKELLLRQNADGQWEKVKEPYATIECPTEEDFLYIQAAVQYYKKHPQWRNAEEDMPIIPQWRKTKEDPPKEPGDYTDTEGSRPAFLLPSNYVAEPKSNLADYTTRELVEELFNRADK